ncbi:MAG: arginine--tRNA ligase [Candidatus Omnitrophica bacterium]|nr:arginine--tRNA ligase [Candidatus Omnitrophota bacterium]
MISDVKEILRDVIAESLKECFVSVDNPPSVDIEVPNEKIHGDFSTNIALKSAKFLKQPPIKLASQFEEVIKQKISRNPLQNLIEKTEIKAPGFINFFLSKEAVYSILYDVFAKREAYGNSTVGGDEKYQIEFVSANPTGPLSVAHARQAAVGDALGNILNALGFKVSKEYYVNDEGNQINILGRSVMHRALEILGEEVAFPEEGYQGDYIKDMAQIFLDKNKITQLGQLKEIADEEVRVFSVAYLLDVIKQDLDDFGVHFDVWSYQSKISDEKSVLKVLDFLKEKKYLYDKDGAVWFRSTDHGDDKDRVIKKSDGAYTYLTPDIAYHKNKFERGYKKIVNIWGPDHHGYIPRISAAVQALGHDADVLRVLIVQLATIYREGKPISMSTRRGQYISLREVIDEVGVDAARFFFMLRHINAPLDFDLELAKKESPENPVYYIQYAHARINSIIIKAGASDFKPKTSALSLLQEEEEMDLIKKIGSFTHILYQCYVEMDPFALVNYMLELATLFHKFYDCHKVVDTENPSLSAERLALIEAVKIVLANGLRLLGVKAPERM